MEYKHFSHSHTLTLYQIQPGQQYQCSGCQTPCLDSVYACFTCNFFLHQHCGNANRFIRHPSHSLHPLILFPSPTYCSGAFICNACGATGDSFSYSCAPCEVDLHVHCAFLPRKANHRSHPHELSLSHVIPQKGAVSNDKCKICNQLMQPKNWNYSCLKCDFRVHTFCATNEVKPGQYLDDQEDDLAPQMNQNGGNVPDEGDQVEVELSEEAFLELYKMKVQMEMAAQFAAVMAVSDPKR